MKSESKEFLKKLIERMRKQDNRATQWPLYYVYQKEDQWVSLEADWDRMVFIDDEGDEVTEITDDEGYIWKLENDGSGDWKCDKLDSIIDDTEACSEFNLRMIYTKEVDIPVLDTGPFLTEEEAKNHIKLNSYHYNKPFIYVNSMWRNWGLRKVIHLLFEIAGEEKNIPSFYNL